MKIGNVEIKGKVICAPMAGITNIVYRKIAKEYGASLVYTEMISDKALCFNSENTYKMIEIDDNEHPVALQLFGGEKEYLVKAVEIINNTSADILDINMGCPVPKVLKSQAGSFWLKDIEDTKDKIQAIVKASKKPVTAKIRLGFDEEHINVIEMAKMLEEAGVSAICVHARTRSQFYTGNARIEYIKKVKESVKIPVIGNGDIKNVESAKKMFDYTGVDGIMIGRAALGNPWVFTNIIEGLQCEKTKKDEITLEKRLAVILEHLNSIIQEKGEYIGIREMRKYLSAYTKKMPNSSEFREKMNKIEDKQTLEKYITEYINNIEHIN